MADPAAAARARVALLQRWLAEDAAGLFAELRERRPILEAPGITVVTRYHDVLEVLGRHQAFSVRLYAPKMERVAGPFVLGLDDTARYEIDSSILRLAFRRDDAARVKEIVSRVTRELLAAARPQGRLELVEQVAHVVPARLVGEYFGVPGPDVTTLQRWARTMFFDIFANLRDDPAAREEALTSGAEMRAYLDQLITDRRAELHASGAPGNDVLTRLVRMQVNPDVSFDDVAIRNNMIGMIVGAIDTNSKAIVQVVDELLRRPVELEAARQAALADDDDLLSRYVFEALRFKPQNSFLVRFCEQPYTIAEGTEREVSVAPGTLVFAANSSAMMDASVVDEPDVFMMDRASFDYLHFGSGLHTCAGRFISRPQILEVVKQILRLPGLRRAQGGEGQVQYDRLFPTRFVVAFDTTQEDDMANGASGIEGKGVHSIITAIVPILPDRLESLRQTLAALGAPDRVSPVSAISTIHFARWVIIDNGERLLFTSNFDGTWDSYIDEFIDKASDGLDLIWSHCVEYPAGGSKDREAFKAYVRKHEYKANLFYCAYDDLTVNDILKARRIREKFEVFLDEFA